MSDPMVPGSRRTVTLTGEQESDLRYALTELGQEFDLSDRIDGACYAIKAIASILLEEDVL